MKAIVVFDSRYGNTEQIAGDLAKGLEEEQIEVACCKTIEVDVEELGSYDLVAVGGPTEMHRASPPMREFLSKLKHVDLKGKYGFAFDTKLDSRWAGEASNSIESTLKNAGAEILMPRSSAIVRRPPKEEQPAGSTEEKEIKRAAAVLQEGMQGKFEKIGRELGVALVQTQVVLPPSP